MSAPASGHPDTPREVQAAAALVTAMEGRQLTAVTGDASFCKVEMLVSRSVRVTRAADQELGS